ncbi:WD40 repeat domain-containing protein [Couchioplanes azureus]|uniref:delta-60 repeat domain-containing protein n=1 Tax=Couchioplanes caeruleus TaxID=56438 RepID=UPI0019A3117F|nr:delta-60 repeat domain-containing protein [Couchioplanes caeruleus]GGQ85112.1 hypothetical protein GCM10010166_64190 [Couchioplanes caeruleus subsp. azureus]
MPSRRRLRPRLLTRALAPAAALGLTIGLTAAPAVAVYVPQPVAATIASADPADFTPHARNGSIRAFTQIGNTIYAGGSFTGIKAAGAGTFSPIRYLVAYDASTGALKTGFTPAFDDAVQSLAVSPDGKLIVGGNFTTVNGVSRKNLVAIDPVTGRTIGSWAGRADGGVVRRTVVHGNHLYIAGAFHWVNGTEHSLLARLNATTGAIDNSFRIDAGVARPYPNSTELVWALAVAPNGRTVVATGNFTKVNGQNRNQVVVIDTSGTPAVADWRTDRYVAACGSGSFPFYARDVDFSDDGSYFAIAADGGSGDGYCDAVARFETAHRGAVQATWVNFTGGDSVTSIEVTDGVVYAAGHFRWLNNADGSNTQGRGGVSRFGFGALDASNGLPMVWNPTRSGGGKLPAGSVGWGPIVWELWKGGKGLYAGFDSDGVAGEYHGRQAFFPASGGHTVPAQDAPKGSKGFLYLGTGNGKLAKVPLEGATVGQPTVTSQPAFTNGGAAFALGNKLYWAKGPALNVSMFTGGNVGAPWLGSGYNAWYNAGAMTGAFYLSGRMYYTVANDSRLFYRYLTPDGSVIGCTTFVLPTAGVNWRGTRGLTWVDNRVLFGTADGALRSAPFDPAAAVAVNGAAVSVLAPPSARVKWSDPTLFFATS